jgi:hypothetical protein
MGGLIKVKTTIYKKVYEIIIFLSHAGLKIGYLL